MTEWPLCDLQSLPRAPIIAGVLPPCGQTTNFDPRTVYQNGSPKLTMVERYRPMAPDKIEWSVTLNDPDTWTRPWTFGMTLTEDPR